MYLLHLTRSQVDAETARPGIDANVCEIFGINVAWCLDNGDSLGCVLGCTITYLPLVRFSTGSSSVVLLCSWSRHSYNFLLYSP